MRRRAELPVLGRLGLGRLALSGLALLAFGGCGGDGPERLRVYHLETALDPPGERGELRCGPPRPSCPGVVAQPPPGEVRYEVRGPPGLDGDDIDRTGVTAAGATVSVPLTAAGTRAFELLTREVARHGGRDQAWHHLLVVVGDEVVAFPEIDFDEFPDGLVDAPAVRIAAIDPADARALVRRLRGG